MGKIKAINSKKKSKTLTNEKNIKIKTKTKHDIKPLTGSKLKRQVYLAKIRQREQQYKAPVCKYFLSGCCTNDDCTFSHDATPEMMRRFDEPCKYYGSGDCNKGEMCCYMHGGFPCVFYHSDGGKRCLKGDKCLYSHDPLTVAMRESLNKYIAKQEEIKNGTTKIDDQSTIRTIQSDFGAAVLHTESQSTIESLLIEGGDRTHRSTDEDQTEVTDRGGASRVLVDDSFHQMGFGRVLFPSYSPTEAEESSDEAEKVVVTQPNVDQLQFPSFIEMDDFESDDDLNTGGKMKSVSVPTIGGRVEDQRTLLLSATPAPREAMPVRLSPWESVLVRGGGGITHSTDSDSLRQMGFGRVLFPSSAATEAEESADEAEEVMATQPKIDDLRFPSFIEMNDSESDDDLDSGSKPVSMPTIGGRTEDQRMPHSAHKPLPTTPAPKEVTLAPPAGAPPPAARDEVVHRNKELRARRMTLPATDASITVPKKKRRKETAALTEVKAELDFFDDAEALNFDLDDLATVPECADFKVECRLEANEGAPEPLAAAPGDTSLFPPPPPLFSTPRVPYRSMDIACYHLVHKFADPRIRDHRNALKTDWRIWFHHAPSFHRAHST